MWYYVYVANHYGYSRCTLETQKLKEAVNEANAWAEDLSERIGAKPKRPHWLLRLLGSPYKFHWSSENGIVWIWIAPSKVRIKEPFTPAGFRDT